MTYHPWRMAILSVFLLCAACGETSSSEKASSETAGHDGGASSQEAYAGMEFHYGDFDTLLAKAKAENKLVFVDVYTDWCGPCKVMQEEVFPDPKIGAYFNARFVNYKLNAEDESQNGPELAAVYKVDSYPTYLVLDAEGRELHRARSSLPVDQFIDLFAALLGETESANLSDLLADYDAVEASPEATQSLLLKGKVAYSAREKRVSKQGREDYKRLETIAHQYIADRGMANMLNPVDAGILIDYNDKVRIDTETGQFILSHYKELAELTSETRVGQFVLDGFLWTIYGLARAGDDTYRDYLEMAYQEPASRAFDNEKRINPDDPDLRTVWKSNADLYYLQAIGDEEAIAAEIFRRAETAGESITTGQYRDWARWLQQLSSEDYQQKALEYAKTAYEMEPEDRFNAADYANMLKKHGKVGKSDQIAEAFLASKSDTPLDQEHKEWFLVFTGRKPFNDLDSIE